MNTFNSLKHPKSILSSPSSKLRASLEVLAVIKIYGCDWLRLKKVDENNWIRDLYGCDRMRWENKQINNYIIALWQNVFL